jgi:hypothetical protein
MNIKAVPTVITLACAALLCACATNSEFLINKDSELRLNDGLSIKITDVNAGMGIVRYDRYTYKPNDKSKVIASVNMDITNSGNIDYNITVLQSLELVFTSDYETPDFVRQERLWYKEKTSFLGLKNDMVMKTLPQGKTKKEKLFFVHAKDQVPVAFVNNRTDWIIFFDDSDAKYNAVLAALEKEKNIQLMMIMAQHDSFENVNAFRETHNIAINASNRFGHNLLTTGLVYGNTSVFYGALKNGGDIHTPGYFLGEGEVEPIHLAVLAKNTIAIIALVAAGADVNCDTGVLPAVLAVRNKDLATLKVLYELGANLKDLKIPMAWSGTQPAILYSRQRNMTEIADFLESIQ